MFDDDDSPAVFVVEAPDEDDLPMMMPPPPMMMAPPMMAPDNELELHHKSKPFRDSFFEDAVDQKMDDIDRSM